VAPAPCRMTLEEKIEAARNLTSYLMGMPKGEQEIRLEELKKQHPTLHAVVIEMLRLHLAERTIPVPEKNTVIGQAQAELEKFPEGKPAQPDKSVIGRLTELMDELKTNKAPEKVPDNIYTRAGMTKPPSEDGAIAKSGAYGNKLRAERVTEASQAAHGAGFNIGQPTTPATIEALRRALPTIQV
jgi:hypothetical protein